MDGQMSIFDILPIGNTEAICIDATPEDEMVKLIGYALGIVFKYNGHLEQYEHVQRKLKLTVQYSNYDLEDNHDRFISCGWDNSKTHSGGGRPCDSMEEAVKYLRTVMKNEREKNETKVAG